MKRVWLPELSQRFSVPARARCMLLQKFLQAPNNQYDVQSLDSNETLGVERTG